MSWRRWALHDPSGALVDWTLPINPNQMDPQQLLPAITPAPMQGDGLNSDTQGPTQPMQWSFQGTLFTLAELDTLETWLNLGLPVQITDHWGFHMSILINGVDTVRAGKRRNTGRHTYTVHALILTYPRQA